MRTDEQKAHTTKLMVPSRNLLTRLKTAVVGKNFENYRLIIILTCCACPTFAKLHLTVYMFDYRIKKEVIICLQT